MSSCHLLENATLGAASIKREPDDDAALAQ
jgi:hypothetical protein